MYVIDRLLESTLSATGERAAAGSDPASGIGGRLASHRVRRGMRVSALAREVGVSASLISQIERGQSRPSVSTLFALSEALAVPVDALFRDPGGAPGARAPEEPAAVRRADRHLVRGDQRAAIGIEGGVRWERLTPTQLAELEFMELVYSPGAESHPAQYRHPGMEMVVVLEGRLDIDVAPEHYELGPGDSVCFPSTTLHRYANPTDKTTRAVTVILSDGGTPRPR